MTHGSTRTVAAFGARPVRCGRRRLGFSVEGQSDTIYVTFSMLVARPTGVYSECVQSSGKCTPHSCRDPCKAGTTVRSVPDRPISRHRSIRLRVVDRPILWGFRRYLNMAATARYCVLECRPRSPGPSNDPMGCK